MDSPNQQNQTTQNTASSCFWSPPWDLSCPFSPMPRQVNSVAFIFFYFLIYLMMSFPQLVLAHSSLPPPLPPITPSLLHYRPALLQHPGQPLHYPPTRAQNQNQRNKWFEYFYYWCILFLGKREEARKNFYFEQEKLIFWYVSNLLLDVIYTVNKC